MPTADVFATLGFLTHRNFLESETCGRLREAVRSAPSRPATVIEEERGYDEVDRTSRSTGWVQVEPDLVELVEQRLAQVRPEVEKHYRVPLTNLQRLQFLVYRKGDFFHRHTDRSEGDDAPPLLRSRRVAAVIFLNGEGDPATSEAFRGGELTFYGLFEPAAAETLGVPLAAEEGLLVTFPADVMHEVRPVEAGERYTIVTWFADESARDQAPVEAER